MTSKFKVGDRATWVHEPDGEGVSIREAVEVTKVGDDGALIVRSLVDGDHVWVSEDRLEPAPAAACGFCVALDGGACVDCEGYKHVGAERMVTSDTGGTKGVKLAAFDAIPSRELWELAERYGRGREKYPKSGKLDNFRKGYDWSLSYAALQRHANAFWAGEDIDPETGDKHIIAVAWHALTLAHFMNRPDLARFDDRQDKEEA